MSPLTLVMLVTIAVGTTAMLIAWRERPEPGAMPLVAMLAGQTWWSAFFVFEVEAASLGTKILWSNIQWIGVVVIPVAWLLFALEYTGRDQYVQPRYIAVLSLVPIGTVLLALTGDYHDLLYLKSHLVAQDGVVMLNRVGGPWFWVITGYTYFLGLLGSIPLLGLIQSDTLPFRGQSLALLLGTLAPWASNAFFLLGVSPIPGLDPTPIAFTISGVAYLGALTRFRLFGTSPSPNRRARRLVFERMQDGAVVVDNHDYLVDMNERAATILETTTHEALGNPARDLIPGYEALPAEGSASEHLTIHGETGEQPYDVTVTRINDFHDRTVGRLITFHDIGEYLRQQQRLEVLNRVLRHNIRTETNLIYGYADLMDDDESDEAAMVKERAMQIEDIGEQAREIVDLFERGREPDRPVSLADLLAESVASVREAFPGVAIDYQDPPVDIQVAGVLRPVFTNAIENAAEHNTSDEPHVWIDYEHTADRVRVSITDNGPGIDEYERSVLEQGTETPLEHGSGLGLWLVKWGTDIAEGRVEFAENQPTGSIVTVDVPVLDPTSSSSS